MSDRPKPDRPRLVLCDLDGTLADVEHRLHFIQRQPKDWEAFFLACGEDDPIPSTITVLRLLHGAGYEIVIVSGRSDLAERQTIEWLERHRVPFDRMLLRRHGDKRHDVEIKAEMVREHGITPDDTLVVFEDRASVVRAWRERGFHVFQVAEGDF